jgi:hypothetical protein
MILVHDFEKQGSSWSKKGNAVFGFLFPNNHDGLLLVCKKRVTNSSSYLRLTIRPLYSIHHKHKLFFYFFASWWATFINPAACYNPHTFSLRFPLTFPRKNLVRCIFACARATQSSATKLESCQNTNLCEAQRGAQCNV